MRLRTLALIVSLALGLFAETLPAEAQQPGQIYRIGFLSHRSSAVEKPYLAAFQQGLKELGYVEGQNIVIEQRYGKRRQLPALAAELLRLKVDIIVTGGGGARAAKKASSTIPIVMTYHSDPVGNGLVASLAHPGGNVTGLSDQHGDLTAKRLGLLKEVVPLVSRVAVLGNPASGASQRMLKDVQATAPALGVTLLSLEVKGPDDLNRSLTSIRKERPGALFVLGGTRRHRNRIVDLAAKSRLPAIYTHGGWVNAGGLMAYGANFADLYRRAASYVDKILKGAKPGDLPIEQPKKFDLVINLKTAKQLGITIPPSVLYRADKVIK